MTLKGYRNEVIRLYRQMVLPKYQQQGITNYYRGIETDGYEKGWTPNLMASSMAMCH
jgi:hypothetical protein